MRSVWKGHIRFSLVTIPIQVFNAVETKHNISFNQLHKKDHGRVGYKKYCKQCDDVLSKKDIIKGYEYEDDQYVVFTDDELKSIKLDSTQAIEVEAFIPLEEVHPSQYEHVYYIGPNGDIAQDTYGLFNQTLHKTRKAAVGRIILRDREDVVLLVAEGKAIIMYKLRYPYELRSIADVPDVPQQHAAQDQLQLAETLVESLSKSYDDIDFTDRYKDAIAELVQNKIDGKEIVEKQVEEKPVIDIMTALKQSIENSKKAS